MLANAVPQAPTANQPGMEEAASQSSGGVHARRPPRWADDLDDSLAEVPQDELVELVVPRALPAKKQRRGRR